MDSEMFKVWNRWIASRRTYGRSPAKFDHQLVGWIATHEPAVLTAALDAVVGARVDTYGT